jgi:hypothetical protein
VVEGKGLTDHPADRQPDVVHPRETEPIRHTCDIARELFHRVIPGNRVTTAVSAHIEPQDAKSRRQQGRHLLDPTAAVGGERVGNTHHRAVLGAGEIVIKAASGER